MSLWIALLFHCGFAGSNINCRAIPEVQQVKPVKVSEKWTYWHFHVTKFHKFADSVQVPDC
jgi:hypothetical protein